MKNGASVHDMCDSPVFRNTIKNKCSAMAGGAAGRTSRTMEILTGPVELTSNHPPALAPLNIAKQLIFCFGDSSE